MPFNEVVRNVLVLHDRNRFCFFVSFVLAAMINSILGNTLFVPLFFTFYFISGLIALALPDNIVNGELRGREHIEMIFLSKIIIFGSAVGLILIIAREKSNSN